MSVRPSVHLSVGVEQLDSHWTDFHEILYLSIFRKSVETVLLKYDKKKRVPHVKTFVITSRSVLFRTRNVSNKICRENQNTHFVINNFFPNIVPFVR